MCSGVPCAVRGADGWVRTSPQCSRSSDENFSAASLRLTYESILGIEGGARLVSHREASGWCRLRDAGGAKARLGLGLIRVG